MPCGAAMRRADTDCATSICNDTTRVCACPEGMVIAPVAGGGSYCIDQYEVTKQEYNVFMQASPVLAGLPAECAGNIYQPSNGWPYTEGRAPMNYVDWCDAYAYCTYMGKHLCGRIGGGASSPTELASAEQNEWYNACSGQGVNEYPDGHVYEPKCKVDDPTGPFAAKPEPNTPAPGCVGGVTGLYHMSGNTAEWENSCDAEGNCLVRGGSRASEPDAEDDRERHAQGGQVRCAPVRSPARQHRSEHRLPLLSLIVRALKARRAARRATPRSLRLCRAPRRSTPGAAPPRSLCPMAFTASRRPAPAQSGRRQRSPAPPPGREAHCAGSGSQP